MKVCFSVLIKGIKGGKRPHITYLGVAGFIKENWLKDNKIALHMYANEITCDTITFVWKGSPDA